MKIVSSGVITRSNCVFLAELIKGEIALVVKLTTRIAMSVSTKFAKSFLSSIVAICVVSIPKLI